MKVIDEPLLARTRAARFCEWCKRLTPNGCDPHHLICRGHGGGSRLDVAENLVALCRDCHRSHHDGHEPTYADLLWIVSVREKVSQQELEEGLWTMLRRAK